MGTVIITGANSSLAIPSVGYLLSTYRPTTVILTVRDDSNKDQNTTRLREIIRESSTQADVTIRRLDLASLRDVHKFAADIRSEIAGGRIPSIVATIWNAMSWTLHGGLHFTSDGFERSIAVNHIAHFALTLELLGSFDTERGRIIFLGSESHEKAASKELKFFVPMEADLLVHPPPDKEGETVNRGLQRFGLSKLASTMAMYELNRRMTMHDQKVRALVVDPGGLITSRTTDTSSRPHRQSRMMQPFRQFLNPSSRQGTKVGKDVIDLAMSSKYVGQAGYWSMGKRVKTSRSSHDAILQSILWNKSLEWAGVRQKDTVIPLGIVEEGL